MNEYTSVKCEVETGDDNIDGGDDHDKREHQCRVHLDDPATVGRGARPVFILLYGERRQYHAAAQGAFAEKLAAEGDAAANLVAE